MYKLCTRILCTCFHKLGNAIDKEKFTYTVGRKCTENAIVNWVKRFFFMATAMVEDEINGCSCDDGNERRRSLTLTEVVHGCSDGCRWQRKPSAAVAAVTKIL